MHNVLFSFFCHATQIIWKKIVLPLRHLIASLLSVSWIHVCLSAISFIPRPSFYLFLLVYWSMFDICTQENMLQHQLQSLIQSRMKSVCFCLLFSLFCMELVLCSEYAMYIWCVITCWFLGPCFYTSVDFAFWHGWFYRAWQ